jgi:NADH:ubiquinone oxidoreductase subunit
VKVGEDDQGNIYYQFEGRGTALGDLQWRDGGEPGTARLARLAAFTWDKPPTEAPLAHKPWEKPHRENLSGSDLAYAPPGSIRRGVPVERRDYEAWQPE